MLTRFQVSNEAACIKIAIDFLCIEGIPATLDISSQFRRHQDEGLLSVEAMLWHAWTSISRQLLHFPTLAPAELSRKQKKRKARREVIRASGGSKKSRTEHGVR